MLLLLVAYIDIEAKLLAVKTNLNVFVPVNVNS